MRKVLLQMGPSVDGIVAGGPTEAGEAGATEEDEAGKRWKGQSLHEVGTHIMGRRGSRPYRDSAMTDPSAERSAFLFLTPQTVTRPVEASTMKVKNVPVGSFAPGGTEAPRAVKLP